MRILFFIILFLSTTNSFSQQLEVVDFIRVEALVRPNYSEKKVSANVTYSFKILQKCDSVFLDAINIKLLNTYSENKIEINSSKNKIWLVSKFKPNKTYSVSFSYDVNPKKAVYRKSDLDPRAGEIHLKLAAEFRRYE